MLKKIITKNGEPVVAMIDAKRLDHHQRLERAQIHLLLLAEAEKGWSDIEAGRTQRAQKGLTALWAKRKQTLAGGNA